MSLPTTPNRQGECFGDATIAAAMIDRIVHRAEIFTHKGDSFRITGHENILPSIVAEREHQIN
ncbi:ATP-binding protein [Corynebacterium vitaeruminis]|uniref:ATP-binding protein n=1 Tax=Corynebacterium vitaeruminis TaxID=38305 RepID=UPI000A7D19CB|nr:ATP-binding protein [Corynebacterium vitaeruminis]